MRFRRKTLENPSDPLKRAERRAEMLYKGRLIDKAYMGGMPAFEKDFRANPYQTYLYTLDYVAEKHGPVHTPSIAEFLWDWLSPEDQVRYVKCITESRYMLNQRLKLNDLKTEDLAKNRP